MVAQDDASIDFDIEVVVRLAEGFPRGGLELLRPDGRTPTAVVCPSRCEVDVIKESIRRERLRVEIENDPALAFEQGARRL